MAKKTIHVVRPFVLTNDDHSTTTHGVGKHLVESEVADHWFTKAHLDGNVETDAERLAREAEENAARLEADRAAKEAEDQRLAKEQEDAEAAAKKAADDAAKEADKASRQRGK